MGDLIVSERDGYTEFQSGPGRPSFQAAFRTEAILFLEPLLDDHERCSLTLLGGFQAILPGTYFSTLISLQVAHRQALEWQERNRTAA